ncbi:MAG TPA: FAD-dependent oxidoreductase [Microbacterium sp.]|uniref:NAD(P)/FAD-dependent oxidoreductase n=1 Tax=Microbacterium sp. TaxID=51671 RepID=UPI002D09BFC5|nr:FAD-dependent oxidoreductase [Microbacterium sp.]HWI30076.1 FAD-dependent oxidoreductase [Microbacterium sp.]
MNVPEPAGIDRTVVIVGGGQGGLTLAVTLRECGWIGRIVIVDTEPGDPYQRPPLSKGFLTGDQTHADLVTRSRELLARDSIELLAGTTVIGIDRERRTVALDDGDPLAYDVLVLATGARPRALPLEGASAHGVHVVRTREDAESLLSALRRAADIVIIGGGFLGLELASAAAHFGRVTVIESAPALLGRSLSAPTARALAARHASDGTTLLLATGVARIVSADGHATGVELHDGREVPADLVIVSVGAQPNLELAAAAGIATADGIVVTGSLRTSDPAIYAIGDCANYPHPHVGEMVRLESVQNAVDQARHLAAALAGSGAGDVYAATPWFWSHQAGQNLQIAGIAVPSDDAVVVEENGRRLTVARVRDGLLTAVETLNSPRIHIRARKLLARGPAPADAIEGLAYDLQSTAG